MSKIFSNQRLIIRFEHDGGIEECILSRPSISGDDLFWLWFINVWPCLGLDFIKSELELEEK